MNKLQLPKGVYKKNQYVFWGVKIGMVVVYLHWIIML